MKLARLLGIYLPIKFILLLGLLYHPLRASYDKEPLFSQVEIELKKKGSSHLFSLEKYFQEIQYLRNNSLINLEDLTHLLVLSGRSSYLGTPIDYPDVEDIKDDFNRIQKAIDVGRQYVKNFFHKETITLQEIEEKGPVIIYNGNSTQNDHLKQALDTQMIADYPASKFMILDLEEIHTQGQIKSLSKEFLRVGIPLESIGLGIVTHMYHMPRVTRYLNPNLTVLGNVNKIFYLPVDPYFQAPHALKDIIGELERIPLYVARGHLSANPFYKH